MQVEHILNKNMFMNNQHFFPVCNMINGNVAAIFGPSSSKTSGEQLNFFELEKISLLKHFSNCLLGIASAICKKLKVPYFMSVWQPIEVDNFNSTDSFTRNLFPHPKKYSQALAEIVKSFRWKIFAIVYDEDDNLVRYQNTFSLYSSKDMQKQPIRFYKLRKDSNDYKPLLKDISKSGTNQVIIDCSLVNTYSVLKQSLVVGMMSEYVVSFVVPFP